MKHISSVGFFSVLMFLASHLYAGESKAAPADSTRTSAGNQPALWAQAVQIFDANKKLVPGKAFQKIQELDNEGRVKSETDVDVSLSLDQAGKIKSEIMKASKDGKDSTKEQRKKAEEAAKKDAKNTEKKKSDSGEHSHSISLEDSPFNPEVQGDVRVTETKGRETIDGMNCACFEYTYPEKKEAGSKGKPATVKGKAWIEESSGHPIKIEYTTEPLPRGVKTMLTTLRYGAGENGSWVLKEMAFEARAAFLFLKKRIRGEITFSDHWKYEEPVGTK